MSPLLHQCAATDVHGCTETSADSEQISSFGAKPRMISTCSNNTHKLSIADALSITPIWDAPEAGFELTKGSAVHLVLRAPAAASAHACWPCDDNDADDSASEAILACTREFGKGSIRSSATSVSMLSMRTAAQSQPSGSTSGLASGATSPLPAGRHMRTVQGGELEIPEGVSVDIEGSFVFSKVHFRGAPPLRPAVAALSMYLVVVFMFLTAEHGAHSPKPFVNQRYDMLLILMVVCSHQIVVSIGP